MKIENITKIAVFAAIIFILSLIKFSIGPVPITLQTLGVMLAGSLLGSKKGFLATLVYTLTIFPKIFSLTGGFVLSFPIAAFLIGRHLEKKGYSTKEIIIGNLLYGVILVYGLGSLGFAYVGGYSLAQTLALAVIPFIPGDLLKVAAVYYIVSKYKEVLIK
ncbi:MAG: biotin transporter BioY [Clostridia bacterium]